MGMQETSDSNGGEVLYYDSDPEDARERTLKRGLKELLLSKKIPWKEQNLCVEVR